MPKKILMIATGGTIACERSSDGLVPQLTGNKLLELLPQLRNIGQIEIKELMQIDSSNITPKEWLCMAHYVDLVKDDYDGFVITHGTDTMAYTATALYHILKNFPKPLAITGSQLPMEVSGSDAPANLTNAFLTAASDHAGIFLVFNGLIHNALYVKKLYSENFIGFASINHSISGKIQADTITWLEEKTTPINAYQLCDRLEEKVCVLKLLPGNPPDLIDLLVKAGYRGIIVEGFGSGGVPTIASNNFIPAIKRAVQKGVAIVSTTQCLYDGAHLDKYPIGILAAREGAISGGYFTTEALAIRLMQALGETTDLEKIKQYFQ